MTNMDNKKIDVLKRHLALDKDHYINVPIVRLNKTAIPRLAPKVYNVSQTLSPR